MKRHVTKGFFQPRVKTRPVINTAQTRKRLYEYVFALSFINSDTWYEGEDDREMMTMIDTQ